jgi:uncharacterized protein (UPF0248 family)
MSIDFPRDVLLKHAWSSRDLEELIVVVLSRGSPCNRSSIQGSRIDRIGRSFMEVDDGTMIPFHRIIEIWKEDTLVWERGSVSRS